MIDPRLRLPVYAMFAFLAFDLAASAQTGQITGRISDPSDLPVAGAAITVRNTDTAIAREVSTNADGYFVAPLLPRGGYEVTVRSAGFKPIVRSNLNLDEGQILRLDFALQVGDVKDTVEVTATAPVLEKDTGMMSTVVSSEEITQLPMLDANIIGLTALTPAVKPIGGTAFDSLPISSANSGRMSIAGGPPGSNNYQIDGVAAENAATGNMSVFLMPDSVQEFRVIARNPSAEFGRTGGGAVLVVSKSGTNQYHLTAYEYLRNTKLNANSFFTNRVGQPRPETKINQWGATFGGPIVKQKTFVFLNYDGIEQRAENEVTRSVPTAAQRNGDFQGTLDTQNRQVNIYDPLSTRLVSAGVYARDLFPNNVIPADRISPIAKKVLSYVPVATQAGIGSTGGNNFYARGSTPTTKRVYGAKVDHNFSANRRASIRFTRDTSFYWYGPSYFGPVIETTDNQNTLPRISTALNYTDVLRPNLLFEFRGGVNQYNIRSVIPAEGKDFALSTLGLSPALQSQMQVLMFPSISIAGVTSIGPASPFKQGNYQHSYSASLTNIFGTHTMKYGGEFRMYQINNTQRNSAPLSMSFGTSFTQGPNPNTSGTNVGSGMATFLLGYPTSGTASISSVSTYTIKYQGFFVQDDWRITPKLTLNIGLRWEHEGPYTDRYNAMTNFDLNKQYTAGGMQLTGALAYPGTNGIPRGVRDTSMHDWQPRFGFAYQVLRKTVVHGGYGLYFLPTTGNNISLGRSGFDMNTSLVATDSTVLGGFMPMATIQNPYPKGLAPALGSSAGDISGIGTAVSATARWLRRGYAHQFNLEMQQELPSKIMLGLGYAANRGTGLQAARTYDYVPFAVRQRYAATEMQAAVRYPYCGLMQASLICNANTTVYGLLDQYPQFSGVTVLDNWADSIYHAFTLKVTRRFTKSFTLLGSYVFSKLLDNNSGNGTQSSGDGSNSVQDWDNLRLDRANSQLDTPHRVVITALYTAPSLKGSHRVVRGALGGWQVNTIVSQWSGDPIGVTTSAGGKLYAGSRPNLIGDPQPANQSIDRWLDPAAFAVAAERSVGNAPRHLSTIRTDWRKDFTLSILKTFPVTERWKMQFRVAANNFTNTPVFGQPGSGFGASTFGVITSTVNSPRRIQFGLKLMY